MCRMSRPSPLPISVAGAKVATLPMSTLQVSLHKQRILARWPEAQLYGPSVQVLPRSTVEDRSIRSLLRSRLSHLPSCSSCPRPISEYRTPHRQLNQRSGTRTRSHSSETGRARQSTETSAAGPDSTLTLTPPLIFQASIPHHRLLKRDKCRLVRGRWRQTCQSRLR